MLTAKLSRDARDNEGRPSAGLCDFRVDQVELGRAVREFCDRLVNDETDDYGLKSGSNG